MDIKMSNCGVLSIAKPSDEYGRQKALERLQILDSPSEKPFEEITKLVSMTLGVPICAVSLLDEDRQWFKSSQGLGIQQTCRSAAICDHAIKADAPFIVEDATLDARFAKNPFVTGEPYIRAYAGIPLRMPDGYLIGTLCAIDKKPRAFSNAEIAVLANFARLVVGEIELREAASVDALTRIASRQAWRTATEKALAQGKRDGTPTALLLFDLDHFKTINDTHGHLVGDLVLRAAAATVQKTIRRSDIFGRVGGEEFAITLPDTDLSKAGLIAEKVRHAVQRLRFEEVSGLECTISVGGAIYDPGSDISEWIAAADKRLYLAKNGGRNRVEMADRAVKRVPQANLA
ncbi:diguanylate cyclase [Erythrobacter gaetbuli]|uniref:diguanylate cyclase n=1 Tax=Qipengyuania gaetbuli TaxID=266952 RepID=A0A844Y0L6_9SPHN|nr:sensor domain-containing diguanylate cyclase [Qipengyuania gaetbuli]MXO50987.1 diguanylate cyclase [Qipengyuania gaetbuli]